jgi:hypothetical protein
MSSVSDLIRDISNPLSKNWCVDPVSGSDSNDGSPAAPFQHLRKALQTIGGITSITWADGSPPSWVSEVRDLERLPATVGSDIGFQLRWRKPGDGFIYISLGFDPTISSSQTPLGLTEQWGPEVKFAESTTPSDVWLYDGLVTASRNRHVASFGIKLSFSLNPTFFFETTELTSLDKGDGSQVLFTGTLPHFPVVSPFTTLYGSTTGGTETFTDDGLGNLTGDLGGSGTINYTNGNYSITFANPLILDADLFAQWNYDDGEGTAKFVSNVSGASACDVNMRCAHNIYVLGGPITETIPCIRNYVTLIGRGISLGMELLYFMLGFGDMETSITPSIGSDANLLPVVTVFNGTLRSIGVSFGFQTTLSGGGELVAPVSAGATEIEVDDASGFTLGGQVYGFLKLGATSDPHEILKFSDLNFYAFDMSDSPEPRESVPGAGYDVIVLNADNGRVGTTWPAAGKFTLSLAITGFVWDYTAVGTLSEGGLTKSYILLATPISQTLVDAWNFMMSAFPTIPGIVALGGINNKIPLLRPLDASWPSGTGITYWSPPCICELWSVKTKLNDCSLITSSAGIFVPPVVGAPIATNLMAGLWEVDISEERNAMFIVGKGTPGILNYSFMPHRYKIEQLYFLGFGDCHLFDYPAFDLILPWAVTPIPFSEPMINEFTDVMHSMFAYLDRGGPEFLIRERGGKKYKVHFEQNAYAKTNKDLPVFIQEFLLGTAIPDDLLVEFDTSPGLWPTNALTQDPNPMAYPDQYKAGGSVQSLIGPETVLMVVRTITTHLPISGVAVAICDATGVSILATGKTNGSGNVVLDGNTSAGYTCPVGAYSIKLYKGGANFEPSYPISVVAGGPNAFILEGTEIVIPGPVDPTLCRVYGWATDGGTRIANCKVTALLTEPGAKAGLFKIISHKIEVITDATGYWQLDLIPNASITQPGTRYRFAFEREDIDYHYDVQKVVPIGPVVNFNSL